MSRLNFRKCALHRGSSHRDEMILIGTKVKGAPSWVCARCFEDERVHGFPRIRDMVRVSYWHKLKVRFGVK